MKFEQFLQSLDDIGMTKCTSLSDYVKKFSYSDCNYVFITIWTNPRKCVIWENLIILNGEIAVSERDYHQYDIDSEGNIVITKLKELVKQYKQLKIELKKNELNKDFV